MLCAPICRIALVEMQSCALCLYVRCGSSNQIIKKQKQKATTFQHCKYLTPIKIRSLHISRPLYFAPFNFRPP